MGLAAKCVRKRNGAIKSDMFQKLMAEILEKGKVFQNMFVTDLSCVFDFRITSLVFIKYEFLMKVGVFVIFF